MSISFLIVPGLNYQVKENIKKRQYSKEDLHEIYKYTLNNISKTKSVLIGDAIIFLIVFGFISYQIISSDALVFGIIFGVSCYLISLLIVYLGAKSVKNQFPKLLKKYYPEYYDEIINGQSSNIEYSTQNN